MFLDKTLENNMPLVDYAFFAHRRNLVEPDTYLVDLDTFFANADRMLAVSRKEGVGLYFMLKQLGRNPYLARELVRMGYPGAVAVDFREAELMARHGIPIGNAGHLVQIPDGALERLIYYGMEHVTVYSKEKIERIDGICAKLGKRQGILLRVYGDGDKMYSGQSAGFHIGALEKLLGEIRSLPNVEIKGVTSFPCILFDDDEQEFKAQENMITVRKAASIMEGLGIVPRTVDMPSATCSETIPIIRANGGNFGEPGHGLTGTTPGHAAKDLKERQCVVYLSEISHNFEGNAYCYGGGHYRRSRVKYALVGKNSHDARKMEVIPPTDESIDYHFGLAGECGVGDAVVMSFRYQIFVTRSEVALVGGLQSGRPRIVGIYDSQGRKKEDG